MFGPYYNENFVKIDEPSFLQALNPLKDNTDEHPTKSGVVCQNFLFECDYLSREEQEELIKPIEKYTYRPPNQTITNCRTFKERSKTQKEVIKQ